MPRRRKSVSPLNPNQVLVQEHERLLTEIAKLKQPGPVTLQSDKMITAIDPVPWELIINWPGIHIEATEDDAAMYWHPGSDEVEMGWKRLGGQTPPSAVYHLISAVGLNEHTIINNSGVVTGYYITNIGPEFRYVKLFDQSGTPDAATDTPILTLGIPPVTAANIGFESFIEFDDGIGIATTTGMADGDTGGVGIQELAINIYYRNI